MSKSSFINKSNQELKAPEEQLARRGTEHKGEKRDKLIRVRTRTYEELVRLGESILDDFDDIISRLIKEHKERRANK
jgi:hypothetical protein